MPNKFCVSNTASELQAQIFRALAPLGLRAGLSDFHDARPVATVAENHAMGQQGR